MRALRAQLAAAAPDAGALAAARLPVERLQAHRVFSGYHALGDEMDAYPLMRRLADAGLAASLPVASRTEPMTFRLWDPRSPMEPDEFGIPAPPPHEDVVYPDLVICPLLAFDRRGHRLGQGKGHYDRTVEQLRERQPVFLLGLAYAGQEVDAVPAEPHDQPLDAILTETEYMEVR
jgi:5-formyltetrahydrofolate cyclo-ligase